MNKLIILLVVTLCLGCSSDDENKNSINETDLSLVTGINLRNSEFSEVIPLGNANIFTDNTFINFPNPAYNKHLRVSSSGQITAIYIIPAVADKQFEQTDFNAVLTSDSYSEEKIKSKAEVKLDDLSSTNLSMNLESLKTGYYKVFVKINGNLYWDNILIPEDYFDINNLIDYWN